MNFSECLLKLLFAGAWYTGFR